MSRAKPRTPFMLRIVESSWRETSQGEFSALFSIKPTWQAFADHWCYENTATDMIIGFATALGKEAMCAQISSFLEQPGPGLMVIGAHGLDPESGQRHLQLRTPSGGLTQVGFQDLKDWVQAVDRPGHFDKALFFDSCSFCANGQAVTSLMKTCRLGMVMGFAKGIEPIDSILLEQAAVNALLCQWHHDGLNRFTTDHLIAEDELFHKHFRQRYKKLAKALGFRVWRWSHERQGPEKVSLW